MRSKGKRAFRQIGLRDWASSGPVDESARCTASRALTHQPWGRRPPDKSHGRLPTPQRHKEARPTAVDHRSAARSALEPIPYLQGAVSDVCPGGWQSAPGSCGPLSLFPGPKLPAYAGAAEIESAATDRMPASILRLIATSWRFVHGLRPGRRRNLRVTRIRNGVRRGTAQFGRFPATKARKVRLLTVASSVRGKARVPWPRCRLRPSRDPARAGACQPFDSLWRPTASVDAAPCSLVTERASALWPPPIGGVSRAQFDGADTFRLERAWKRRLALATLLLRQGKAEVTTGVLASSALDRLSLRARGPRLLRRAAGRGWSPARRSPGRGRR
jgi:hypothetical protein